MEAIEEPICLYVADAVPEPGTPSLVRVLAVELEVGIEPAPRQPAAAKESDEESQAGPLGRNRDPHAVWRLRDFPRRGEH